jgi:hypothetical protein
MGGQAVMTDHQVHYTAHEFILVLYICAGPRKAAPLKSKH